MAQIVVPSEVLSVRCSFRSANDLTVHATTCRFMTLRESSFQSVFHHPDEELAIEVAGVSGSSKLDGKGFWHGCQSVGLRLGNALYTDIPHGGFSS